MAPAGRPDLLPGGASWCTCFPCNSRPELKSQGLLSDQTIRLTGAKSQEGPIPLRRIAYQDTATGRR